MADICLVLEGTYPYITGGVSSWVHDIITNLNDFTFDIVAVLPSKSYAREFKFKIPPNVNSINNLYLNEVEGSLNKKLGYFEIKKFFKELSGHAFDFKELNSGHLKAIFGTIEKYKPSIGDFIDTKEGWNFFLKLYETFDGNFSFIDFFWTMRFILIPIVNITNFNPPDCGCYHSVSTGYAGLLASLFKLRTAKPMILTEHGIYTNERLLEIVNAKWIYDQNIDSIDISRELAPLKRLWINLFIYIGKISYFCSDKIITLFKENMNLQIKLGAPAEKCSVIANGIDCGRFSLKRVKKPEAPDYTIGYVGRIVQIKDIKTLLYAARFVVDKFPGARFILKGPTDEEKSYYQECRILTNLLGLDGSVVFAGPGNVTDFYKDIDLLVLSSISEAQPLALMEANLCRVPVVSTDVGAVRELIYGADEYDMKIGASGSVVPVKSPEMLGMEIVRLLSDADLNMRLGENGEKRVLRYYQKEDLMAKYRAIYKEAIGGVK